VWWDLICVGGWGPTIPESAKHVRGPRKVGWVGLAGDIWDVWWSAGGRVGLTEGAMVGVDGVAEVGCVGSTVGGWSRVGGRSNGVTGRWAGRCARKVLWWV
jgi:hypothetical protein